MCATEGRGAYGQRLPPVPAGKFKPEMGTEISWLRDHPNELRCARWVVFNVITGYLPYGS